jgi:Protein of unknown function (DUF3592)
MDWHDCLCILLLYSFGIYFAIVAVRKGRLLRETMQWASSPGQIIVSEVVKSERQIDCRIVYEFIAGEKILGNTPKLGGNWFWTKSGVKHFVAQYVPRQQVMVYYDASDPRRNCLVRRDSSGIIALWVMTGVVFLVASVWLWTQTRT